MRKFIQIVETMSETLKLTEAAQFKTKEPSADWRERLCERGCTDDSTFYTPQGEQMKRQLLALGGWAAVGLDDEDQAKIISRGQAWPGRGAYFMKGAPSQCHANTGALYEANPDTVQICTGYALSPDGCWRVHSWGLHQGKPVETTVKRVGYFGFVLTPEEAEAFVASNDF